MMRNYTNISVLLCQYALVNQKINQLKLYVYLKINSDGYVVYNDESYKEWGEAIGVHEKTIKTSLKWLIDNKWITGNRKRSALLIISYEKLIKKLNLNLRTGYLVKIEDYKDFKALCCAIVITYYLKRKCYSDKRSGRENGRPNTNRIRNNGFSPMPNLYLAKCIQVSIATACRYKQEAEKAGYIETKPNYTICETCKGHEIGIEHLNLIRKVLHEDGIPNRIKERRGRLEWVEPTLIRSFITYYFYRGKS